MDVVTLKKAVKDAGKYTDQEVSALEALFANSRIVEYGSNENGHYWRWENGLQVIYIPFDPLLEEPDELPIPYPASFVAIPSAQLSFGYGQNSVYREALSSAYIMVQAHLLTLVKPKTSAITTRAARAFAIGRWK